MHPLIVFSLTAVPFFLIGLMVGRLIKTYTTNPANLSITKYSGGDQEVTVAVPATFKGCVIAEAFEDPNAPSALPTSNATVMHDVNGSVTSTIVIPLNIGSVNLQVRVWGLTPVPHDTEACDCPNAPNQTCTYP